MHLIFQAKLGVARDFSTLVVKVEVCVGVGGLKRNKDIRRILINLSIYRCFGGSRLITAFFVAVPKKWRGHKDMHQTSILWPTE